MSRASANAGPAARPLAELTAGFAAVPADVLVSDVTLDSRTARPGALFLACRGRTHHGLEFAADAVSRGARAVLYERDAADGEPVPGATTATVAVKVTAWPKTEGLADEASVVVVEIGVVTVSVR